jgi:drug/metabolite transporter (DMT)-like permease
VLILLPLLRKLPIRVRAVTGAVVLVLGLVGLVIPGLLVAGAAAVVVGAVCVSDAWRANRRLARARMGIAG